MLKLPVWKNLWLWLWVAMLVTVLTSFQSPNLKSTIVAGIMIFIMITIVWFIVTDNDRVVIRAEKKRLSEIKEQIKIFEALTGEKIFVPVYEVYYIGLYYLNPSGSMEKEITLYKEESFESSRLIDFVKKNYLKTWLINISFKTLDFECVGSQNFKPKDEFLLCYDKDQIKYWKINHKNTLVDLDDNQIKLNSAECYEDRFTKILKIATKYRSAKEFAFERICPYAAHVIASTKHSYESPILKELRKLLENPFSILEEGIDPKLSEE